MLLLIGIGFKLGFVRIFHFPITRSRSPFSFPVPRSPFPIPRSSFPVPRSSFPVIRSRFPVPRFPFPVLRFPVPRFSKIFA